MSDKSLSSLIKIDLGDWSKPVTKLIEAVAEFVGVRYEPKRIRRKAEAEADAARTLAKAQVDIDRVLAEGHLELQEDIHEMALRASERISYREWRRQRNVEAIVSTAVHQLPASVSEEAVDEDWIAEFFNVCQDVSNEEMQIVWARLLAGEVAKPGTYSRRTLHFVRLLSPSDAALFRLICNYIWRIRNSETHLVHLYTKQTQELLKRRGFFYESFLRLDSLGLLSFSPTLHWFVEPDEVNTISYFGKRYRLTSRNKEGLHACLLTDIAEELAPLCDSKPDEEYINAIIEAWGKAGVSIEVVES